MDPQSGSEVGFSGSIDDGQTAVDPDPAHRASGTDPFLGTLARLWRRHRPRNLERIATLEAAAVAVLEGGLDDELRAAAEVEAHKLAGSLGTFGFDGGTRIAREIEALLQRPDPDGRHLSELVVALLGEVDRPDDPNQPDDGPATAPEPAAGPGPVRVLLLCDDPSLSEALTVVAPTSRVQIETVPDGPGANRRLGTNDYDVVVADLEVPDASGWQVLTRAGGLENRPTTIALSATEEFSARLTAARLGINGFVPRWTPPRQILDQIGPSHSLEGGETVILAVDDDPTVLAAVSELLSGTGRRLVTAPNAEGFWEQVNDVKPDLAVVELDMVAVGGLDLCRMIRADHRWRKLPVIALSARADHETVKAAFEAGADDCVTRAAGTARVIVGADLEARVDAQIEHSRRHRSSTAIDALTGVDNRWRFEEELSRLIQLAGRQGQPFTLALLGVDDFADVNALGGHATGDAVLRTVSNLLLQNVRGEDIVGRWGGTEFALGMYGMESEGGAQRLSDVIDELRSVPFTTLAGDLFSVSFTAGIAEFPIDGLDPDAVYQAADRARYRARATGSCVLSARAPDSVDTGVDHADVVVVDDDDTLADLIVHALQDRGYEVRRIADGAEAADLLGEGLLTARVVLLDVGLPGLDGFGVIRRLRAQEVLGRTRVIMLTARANALETLNALELGAVDHVSKPFSLPILMERIEKLLAASS